MLPKGVQFLERYEGAATTVLPEIIDTYIVHEYYIAGPAKRTHYSAAYHQFPVKFPKRLNRACFGIYSSVIGIETSLITVSIKFGPCSGCLKGICPMTYRDQTPQEPPYPIETLSPSTTTGTFLTPFECLSISSSFTGSFFTSKY